jgi:hypothetical protein
MQACVSYLSALILLFLDPQFNGYAFTSGLQITVNSIHRPKHLGICLPPVGSQTWVRSGWEFFRPSGVSNPRPWRWIKSARDHCVKCNERRTRPCHRAYYIRGSTPFHLCVAGHRNLCQARIESNRGQGPIRFLLLYRGSSPFTHCATSAGTAPPVPVLRHQCRWRRKYFLLIVRYLVPHYPPHVHHLKSSVKIFPSHHPLSCPSLPTLCPPPEIVS